MRPTIAAWGSIGVLLATLAVATPARAQLGTIDYTVPLCGSSPQSAGADLAYDSVANRLWTIDQGSGQCCRYTLSAFPPDMVFNVSVNHPFGAALPPFFSPLCTGIAFNPTTQNLYVLNASTIQIVEMDQTGAQVGPFVTLSPPLPNAAVSGLAFDTVTGNLWYRDTVNDIAVQCVATTGATVSWISLPGESPMYGSGLDFIQVGGARYLEFSRGNVIDFRPSEVLRIDALTGAPTNVEVPLGQIDEPVLGIVRPPTGTVIYVATEDDLIKLDSTQPATLPPTDLQCASSVSGTVNLTWRNRGPGAGGLYTSVRILRGGTILQMLTGNVTSFVDPDPQPAGGEIAYQVQGIVGSVAAGTGCIVQTGPGGLVNYTEFGGQRPYDLALDPAAERLYVTDNFSDQIYAYDTDLNLQTVIATGLPNLQGIAYNQNLDLLLVSRGGSSLLTQIDPLSGLPVGSQLSMPAGSNIVAITYDAENDDYLYVNAAANPVEVRRIDATPPFQGNFLGSFSPPSTSGLVLGRGICHLAQTDTFLAPVQQSSSGGLLTSVSELYTNGFPSGFSFPFDSIGGSISEANAIQGIEDLANVAYMAGSASNVIFRVLIASGGESFVRGEVNGSGTTDLADAIAIAQYLFTGGAAPACLDAADVNDSGNIDISDPLYLIIYLFASGPLPPLPFPGAGPDPTFLDPLGC